MVCGPFCVAQLSKRLRRLLLCVENAFRQAPPAKLQIHNGIVCQPADVEDQEVRWWHWSCYRHPLFVLQEPEKECRPVHCTPCLQGLVLSTEDASVLELNTRQQARSPTWKAARANRLTASKFHTVLSRKQPWTEQGIANVMRPKAFSNSIVRHGTTNEPRAIQRLGRSVVVSTCGLMPRPSCPWLRPT